MTHARLLSAGAGCCQVCNNALLNQGFVHSKVQTWVSAIIENVLKELAVTNGEAAKRGGQKFKYAGKLLPMMSDCPCTAPARAARGGRRRALARSWTLLALVLTICAYRAFATNAVTCQMQQKTGSAMITACAQYWDKSTDGQASAKWESDAVQVLVTVYGVAI